MRGLEFFRNPEAKRRKIEKEKAIIQKDIKDLAVLAGRCLADKNFQRYVEGVEAMKDRIIDVMLTHTDPDPVRDGFFTRSCLNQLIPLMEIVESIKREKQKGGENASRSA